MASYRAVAAVTEAVVYLLESQYTPAKFDGNQLEFKVYLAKDFEQPMDAGVSLFLYRIYANDTHRTPKGRVSLNGERHRTQLPLDMHFLLTAWGKDASLQHTIAGWMMRVLEDTPVFPAGLLNKSVSNVFHPDETVEVGLTQLTTEELFRIWEVIGNNAYQISVPYVARYVKIESEHLLAEGEAIQERTLDIWELGNP
ncbi:MAG: DUF4255 domain-containing protein [Anaerolineae bacterium]|nr:DUF4255 domain-containing protein [Anaerolineae bacterium]